MAKKKIEELMREVSSDCSGFILNISNINLSTTIIPSNTWTIFMNFYEL